MAYGPWVTPFLNALKREGVVSYASQAAGISSTTAYALRASDADFAEAWRLALEDAMDDVESALRQEATGVDELVVHQGALTPVYERDAQGLIIQDKVKGQDGKEALIPRQAKNPDGSWRYLTVRKRSVPAAIALLKGRRKHVFAERTELTGANGGPVQMDDATRRARIASILAKAEAREGLA